MKPLVGLYCVYIWYIIFMWTLFRFLCSDCSVHVFSLDADIFKVFFYFDIVRSYRSTHNYRQ